MKYIDTDFHNAWGVLCYLRRKEVECDACPIIDGVTEWPDNPLPFELKKHSWRLSYDSDAKGVDHSIEKLLEMFGRGMKYCPFCGGIATIDRCSVTTYEADEIVTWTSYTVECLECGCKTAPGCTEQDVIDVWNRRA